MSTREYMTEDVPKPKPEDPGSPSQAKPMDATASPPAEPKEPATAAEVEPTNEGASPAEAKKRRGFAAMDPARVRAIARKGGVAAHERGTAHRFTATEAREAGRKGGLAPHRSRGGPSKRAA